jgi:hypothetical protein
MRAFIARWLAVGAIGLILGAFTLGADQSSPTPSPEDVKRKAAQDAILNLSQHLGDLDVSAQAKVIVAKHHSEDISSVFRQKHVGGIGIGKAVEVHTRDSVESMVIELSRKKTTTEAQLERYQDEYMRVAKLLQAMAELAPHRATERVRNNPALAKEWAEVAAEFKAGATGFRKAIEEKDPKMLRLGARKMHDTCCHCHSLAD